VIWDPPSFRCEMTKIYFLTNASQTEEPLTTLTADCERSLVLYVNPQMKLLPSTLHKAKRPLKNLITTTTTTTIRLSTDALIANVLVITVRRDTTQVLLLLFFLLFYLINEF